MVFRQKMRLRRAISSQVVETAKGPIECSIVGKGPAVLIIHGCRGGYDQGLIATRLANSRSFKFIALSRPGYLRTPLGVGKTPEAQADSYAALLDALEIPKTAIIGISAGGPSALQFALRHPERCWSLVTICAISQRLNEAEIMNCKSPLRRIFFATELVSRLAWTMLSLLKQKWLKMLAFTDRKDLEYEGRAFSKEENLDVLLDLLRSFKKGSLRKTGLENDITQLTTMSTYPLEDIKAPTMVMHGSADSLVPFTHAEFIANTVPNARLLTVEEGDHLFFATNKQQVAPGLNEFLKLSARNSVPEPRVPNRDDGRQMTADLVSGAQVLSGSLSTA